MVVDHAPKIECPITVLGDLAINPDVIADVDRETVLDELFSVLGLKASLGDEGLPEDLGFLRRERSAKHLPPLVIPVFLTIGFDGGQY